VDWVGALLLGYDPERIPLTRNAFCVSPWRLTDFDAKQVEIAGDLGHGKADDVFACQIPVVPSRYPAGWSDVARTFSTADRFDFAVIDQA
jgi:hypothetical protein